MQRHQQLHCVQSGHTVTAEPGVSKLPVLIIHNSEQPSDSRKMTDDPLGKVGCREREISVDWSCFSDTSHRCSEELMHGELGMLCKHLEWFPYGML